MIDTIRKKLDLLRGNYDPFTVFSLVFAVYALFHFHYDSSNLIQYRLPILFGVAFVLIRPAAPIALATLAGLLLVEHWAGMPTGSNHTIMSFLLSFIIVVAVLAQAIAKRGQPDDAKELFSIIAPAGRALLITMYFFGVFHKINTDFLNPDSSCASALVSFFLFLGPDFQLDRWALLSASYGTLIVESIILVALLFPRTRYWAVCAGVLFHLLISFSAYRNYIPFTLFSMALHAFFLDQGVLERLRQSVWGRFFREEKYWALRLAAAGITLSMYISYSLAARIELDPARSIVVWMPFGLLLTGLILRYDFPGRGLPSSETAVPPATLPARVQKYAGLGVCFVFFLSCFSPYIGLKTSQSIAMFSNLHTENDVFNHLIIKKRIPLFDNLTRSVEIVSVSDLDNPLINFPPPDVQMARYAFEDFMSRHPSLRVTYRLDGKTHTLNGLSNQQITEWLKPELERKFMVFEPIYMKAPKTCFESFDRYRMQYLPDKNRWFKEDETAAEVMAPVKME